MSTYSEEHILFLKKKKKEKYLIIFFQLFILFTFIFSWELLAQLNIINTFLYSSPSKIIKTIINLINSKELFYHIGITIYEVLITFFLSSFLGIIIAFIFWNNKILSRIIDPYITVLNSLPKVALGPLIIIWMGAKINSIIFMAILISLFTTIINIYHGFISVNNNYLIMLRSFKATKLQLFFKAVLPSNLLTILSTLKINISMSLIGVIMGELLVSKKGLGYLIMYGSQMFNLDLVITSIFLLSIISYLMYILIDKITIYIEKKDS